MSTAKMLIQPMMRVSLSSIKSVRHLRLSGACVFGNGAVQTWLNIFKFNLHNLNLPSPYWNLLVRRYHHFPNRIFRDSGGKLAVHTIVGLSAIVGSIRGGQRIAYCADGLEFLEDDRAFSLSEYSDSDEEHRVLMSALKKFLVPLFCLLTVVANWGQPMVIAAKITFMLYATKPSPFSVYLVVEQFRQQAMRQHSSIYKCMSCCAKKVLVEDYVFLCIARVEMDDQNVTLLGILGSWWVLPHSSWLEELYQH